MAQELVKYLPQELLQLNATIENHDPNRMRIHFPNGYTLSVIGGSWGIYGDGVNTFEVAVMYRSQPDVLFLVYDTPITDDVLPWQTKEEVLALCPIVAALPPRPPRET